MTTDATIATGTDATIATGIFSLGRLISLGFPSRLQQNKGCSQTHH